MTTTEFEFTLLTFPVTTLSGDTYNKRHALGLLDRYSERITVRHGQHQETPERFVAESFTANGEPWNWDYRGDSRYDLERAVMTWLLVADDDDLDHTLVVTLPVIACSFCTNPALYVGRGADADFYCDQHRGKARNGLTELDATE